MWFPGSLGSKRRNLYYGVICSTVQVAKVDALKQRIIAAVETVTLTDNGACRG
jgi:hypothetical protein